MSEKVALERTLQPAEPAAWVSGLGQPGRATSKCTGLVVAGSESILVAHPGPLESGGRSQS